METPPATGRLSDLKERRIHTVEGHLGNSTVEPGRASNQIASTWRSGG